MMVVMDNDSTSDDGKENDDFDDDDSGVICSVNGMDDDGMDDDGTGNIDTTQEKKWTQDFTKLNCCLKNANDYLNCHYNILYDHQADLLQQASSGAPVCRGYPSMVE